MYLKSENKRRFKDQGVDDILCPIFPSLDLPRGGRRLGKKGECPDEDEGGPDGVFHTPPSFPLPF